jgi:hypothetical protein
MHVIAESPLKAAHCDPEQVYGREPQLEGFLAEEDGFLREVVRTVLQEAPISSSGQLILTPTGSRMYCSLESVDTSKTISSLYKCVYHLT